MNHSRNLRSAIATFLAVALFVASVPVGAVRAEMVGTDRIIGRMEIDAQRAEIAALLAREDVRDRLSALGVAPDEAIRRVDSLSDAEVLQLAQRIDGLPAGQAQGVSLVVVLLLVIILILII